MKTRKLISFILICVLLLAVGSSVYASGTNSASNMTNTKPEPTGSITVRVETLDGDIPIPGYKLHFARVADIEGVLTADFAGAMIPAKTMLDQSANAKNAERLLQHALLKGLGGTVFVCDDGGELRFDDLKAGIYMIVAGEDNELSFLPFLVYMPTVVNGLADWDVLALPKADEPDAPVPTPTPTPEQTSPPNPGVSPDPDVTPSPGPTVSPGPGGPVKPPSLPQTGINRLPSTLLFVFGICFAVLGTVLIIRGGEKVEEEEDD